MTGGSPPCLSSSASTFSSSTHGTGRRSSLAACSRRNTWRTRPVDWPSSPLRSPARETSTQGKPATSSSVSCGGGGEVEGREGRARPSRRGTERMLGRAEGGQGTPAGHSCTAPAAAPLPPHLWQLLQADHIVVDAHAGEGLAQHLRRRAGAGGGPVVVGGGVSGCDAGQRSPIPCGWRVPAGRLHPSRTAAAGRGRPAAVRRHRGHKRVGAGLERAAGPPRGWSALPGHRWGWGNAEGGRSRGWGKGTGAHVGASPGEAPRPSRPRR